MKLVDILARDLPIWPASGCSIHQGVSGNLFTIQNGDLFITVEKADDWLPAEVSRTEWLVARDSIKANVSPAWVGIGEPPVGTVCEFMKHSPPPATEEWIVGDIRYISDCTVIIGGDKCEHVHHPRNCSFRPIRKPEKIAAEDREMAIEEMRKFGIDAGDSTIDLTCAALYDAGYRKFEIVDGE